MPTTERTKPICTWPVPYTFSAQPPRHQQRSNLCAEAGKLLKAGSKYTLLTILLLLSRGRDLLAKPTAAMHVVRSQGCISVPLHGQDLMQAARKTLSEGVVVLGPFMNHLHLTLTWGIHMHVDTKGSFSRCTSPASPWRLAASTWVFSKLFVASCIASAPASQVWGEYSQSRNHTTARISD